MKASLWTKPRHCERKGTSVAHPPRLTFTGTLAAFFLTTLLFAPILKAASDDVPPSNLAALDSARTDTSALDHKVVYVDFWASWCPPCRQSFPWMALQNGRYARHGLHIVAVDVDRKRKDAVKFLDEINPPFEIIFDSVGALAKRYGLEAMPTTFIYGRDGTLRYSHLGFVPDDTLVLDSVVQSLLKEEPAP
jgi:cytochrome c biogenesis protein CcmG/thiol:disulfide interchange protein DsbE